MTRLWRSKSLECIGDVEAARWVMLAARSPRIARLILTERYGVEIGPIIADRYAELARLWAKAGQHPAFEVGLLRILINDRWMRESCLSPSSAQCDNEICSYEFCQSADLCIP